ncbi:unnamed protein product, partial [Strongylus vulgaris]
MSHQFFDRGAFQHPVGRVRENRDQHNAIHVVIVTLFSSFSRHQLFNRGLPGLYCRPHEDTEHPERKFEPFEFGNEIAESIKEMVLTSDDGTLTGRIQFDPHTGWRTNYSATVIEIKP